MAHDSAGQQGSGWELLEHLPFTTDAGIAHRAKIGFVILASDYTLEHELRQVMTIPGVEWFQTRIENSPEITPDTLVAMREKIPAALATILPGDTLDVVAYGCTSATTHLGEDCVAQQVAKVQPQASVTTPVTAAFAAFRAMNAHRIAVLTPYRSDVNETVRQYIVDAGFEVPVFGSFNESMDPVVANIDVGSIESAVRRITADHDVDMVFVSCTSVRLMQSIERLEAVVGLPVTSSNHAMAWHCLRLAGVKGSLPGQGSLFTRALL
ncbi:MAG: Asp/Glu racemase [Pseudomonadota bacterium]